MSVNRDSLDPTYNDFYSQWSFLSDSNEQDSCNVSVSSVSSSSSSFSVSGYVGNEKNYKHRERVNKNTKNIILGSLKYVPLFTYLFLYIIVILVIIFYSNCNFNHFVIF